MLRKTLLSLFLATTTLTAAAQTPPTAQEQVLLQQMRDAAKRQGMVLTPEMETIALQRMREMQAKILGMQMAAQSMRSGPAPTPTSEPASPQTQQVSDPAPQPSGEAQTVVPPNAAPASTAWTFIGPADNDPALGGFACGIRFGMEEEVGDRAQGIKSAELQRTGETTAQLTTFVGSQDSLVGKGVRHDLGVVVTKDENKCSVSLDIRTAEPFVKGGKFLNLWKPPTFTAADVLVQTHQFLYRPSFTSQYPAAALMANFDRLGVKSCNDVGVPYSRQLPRELRGDVNKMYCVKVDGENIPTVPKCHPYRNGSQCTALVLLGSQRNDRTFDARPSAAKFRAAIDAILNN